MIEFWDYLTAINGILMGIFPLLHVLRMFKGRSSKGQSAAAVLITGVLCGIIWLVYGFLNGLWVIILTSATAIIVQSSILIIILKFRRGNDEN